MTTTEETRSERIVEIVETWDGTVARTFYGVYDPEFGHWMSREPFEGLIWTKDALGRMEFPSRETAEHELTKFYQWRHEQDAWSGSGAEMSQEVGAA